MAIAALLIAFSTLKIECGAFIRRIPTNMLPILQPFVSGGEGELFEVDKCLCSFQLMPSVGKDVRPAQQADIEQKKADKADLPISISTTHGNETNGANICKGCNVVMDRGEVDLNCMGCDSIGNTTSSAMHSHHKQTHINHNVGIGENLEEE